MQKATVICITQGRKWAGRAGFPQAVQPGKEHSGSASQAPERRRSMRIVSRRDTKIVRENKKIGSGFVTGGMV
jgi:hypothetical protein